MGILGNLVNEFMEKLEPREGETEEDVKRRIKDENRMRGIENYEHNIKEAEFERIVLIRRCGMTEEELEKIGVEVAKKHRERFAKMSTEELMCEMTARILAVL